jgi:hypothetical protein
MVGWPTMVTPQMREDARKETEVARQRAVQMGAKN